jgi:hypothetical protein
MEEANFLSRMTHLKSLFVDMSVSYTMPSKKEQESNIVAIYAACVIPQLERLGLRHRRRDSKWNVNAFIEEYRKQNCRKNLVLEECV